jgi:hypothetical protein
MKKTAIAVVCAAALALGAVAIGGAVESSSSGAATTPTPPTIVWTQVSATRWNVPAGDPVTFVFQARSTGPTFGSVALSAGFKGDNSQDVPFAAAPNVATDCTIGITSTDQTSVQPPAGTESCTLPPFPNSGTHYTVYVTVYPKAAGIIQATGCLNFWSSQAEVTQIHGGDQSCSPILTVHSTGTPAQFAQYPITWTPGTN